MKSDFTLAFNEIVEARALPQERVLEALTQALISAYRRDAKVIDSQIVEAELDDAGRPRLMVEKEVVLDVINEPTEIAINEARELDANVAEGDMIMVPVTKMSENFGRIAAQTAKQVILQHIREAEREALYNEYIDRVGELVIGTVQSANLSMVTLDLGRAEAVMPQQHRMPTERYRAHEKIRVFVVEVKKANRGPQIIVSRNHKNMLRRLLEYEVPEIYNGLIEIKNIAREAGFRWKVAVFALQEGVDAVGACVGMRGMRIQNIVKELNDEKIDIIEWDPDPARYIARALSPARVTHVFLEEGLDGIRTATVIVPEDQLSLAIGKEGQNARLAAKLTGWRIDIKSAVEAAMTAITSIYSPPLDSLKERSPELVSETFRILEKKSTNRAVTPEEYNKLSAFVGAAEKLLFTQREAERQRRRDAINVVRPLVPKPAFKLPLEELELADDIMRVIEYMGNIGELWARFMADEDELGAMLKNGGADDDAMDAIRDALDDLVIPDIADMEKEEEEAEVLEAAEEEASEEATASTSDEEATEEDSEETSADEAETAEAVAEPEFEHSIDEVFFADDEEPDIEGVLDGEKAKAKKKAKQRRRQLVFDEDAGEVVAKRRHKRGDADDYEEFF